MRSRSARTGSSRGRGPRLRGQGNVAIEDSTREPDAPADGEESLPGRGVASGSGAAGGLDGGLHAGASGMLGRPALWIGTAGGLGYAPIAPGTFGSAGAVVLFLALPWLDLPVQSLLGLLLAATAVVVFLGVWAAGRCEQAWGRKDDGRIVIDEVAGQWLTLLPVLALGSASGVPEELSAGSQLWWLLVVTAFVAFRGLDIWKPGPVRWAERRFTGGLGVMADDVVAGVIGGVLMTLPCFGLLIASLSSGELALAWPQALSSGELALAWPQAFGSVVG